MVRNIIVSAALGAVLILSSCATFSGVPGEDDFRTVIDMINRGAAEELTAESALPFIFDGEIVTRAEDVDAVWSTLSERGYAIGGTGAVISAKVSADTYTVFSDTADVRLFFEKYVTSGASLGTVQGSAGPVHILLKPGEKGLVGIRLPQ